MALAEHIKEMEEAMQKVLDIEPSGAEVFRVAFEVVFEGKGRHMTEEVNIASTASSANKKRSALFPASDRDQKKKSTTRVNFEEGSDSDKDNSYDDLRKLFASYPRWQPAWDGLPASKLSPAMRPTSSPASNKTPAKVDYNFSDDSDSALSPFRSLYTPVASKYQKKRSATKADDEGSDVQFLSSSIIKKPKHRANRAEESTSKRTALPQAAKDSPKKQAKTNAGLEISDNSEEEHSDSFEEKYKAFQAFLRSQKTPPRRR